MTKTAGSICIFLMFGMTLGPAFAAEPAPGAAQPGKAAATANAAKGKPDLAVLSGVIMVQAAPSARTQGGASGDRMALDDTAHKAMPSARAQVGSSPAPAPVPAQVTWKIKNVGLAASPVAFVLFTCKSLDPQLACPNVAQFSQSIPALAPQATHTVQFPASAVKSGNQFEITATVGWDPLLFGGIAESNTANNKLTVKF